MYHAIKNKLESRDNMTFSEITYKNRRKQVCRKFSIIFFDLATIFELILKMHFFLVGSTKVLYYFGTEKVPSVRNKSRRLICRDLCHQRPKMGQSLTLN